MTNFVERNTFQVTVLFIYVPSYFLCFTAYRTVLFHWATDSFHILPGVAVGLCFLLFSMLVYVYLFCVDVVLVLAE